MSTKESPGKDQAAALPLGRRRGVRWASVATAAVVALAGATFWLSGGYDAWRDDHALDQACEGDLAADEVRRLLPGVELTTSTGTRQEGWFCEVAAADEARDGDATVAVRIRHAESSVESGDGFDDPGEGAVPLGGGWTGSFAYGEGAEQAQVVLLLDCGTESGEGLLARADGRLKRGEDFRDAGARARLTTVLTETALSYARRTGCEPERGEHLTKVAAPVTDRKPQPLGKASGTCEGVIDAGTAQRWGAGTVIETPASGPTAVERCTLGSRLGAPLYAFTASYGPYGEKELSAPSSSEIRPAKDGAKSPSPSGRYRMTATCPGAGGTAVYDIVPGDGLAQALDHGSLRAALKNFAEHSAQRHACDTPT